MWHPTSDSTCIYITYPQHIILHRGCKGDHSLMRPTCPYCLTYYISISAHTYTQGKIFAWYLSSSSSSPLRLNVVFNDQSRISQFYFGWPPTYSYKPSNLNINSYSSNQPLIQPQIKITKMLIFLLIIYSNLVFLKWKNLYPFVWYI